MNKEQSKTNLIDVQMLNAHRLLDHDTDTHCHTLTQNSNKKLLQLKGEVEVFKLHLVFEALKKGGSDDFKIELKALAKENRYKPVACVDKLVMAELEAMKTKFLNFYDVIEHLRKALKISLRNEPSKILLQPILLIGPPGVGKTRFLKELGKVLKTGLFTIDMSTITAGFVLSGNSSQWSDSKPGFVSNTIRQSEVANPLILVDEIDKVNGDRRHNPTASFLSLLQDHSAIKFVDEFLGIPFDCSHINWVASANYLDKIEPAILSRMNVIQVDLPSPEQTRPIVKSIFDELLAKNTWQDMFEPELGADVIDKLSSLAPRMIEQMLVKACHNAFDRTDMKQKCVLIKDDIEVPQTQNKRRIGFIQD
jgi:ATP-dependent Lon protease